MAQPHRDKMPWMYETMEVKLPPNIQRRRCGGWVCRQCRCRQPGTQTVGPPVDRLHRRGLPYVGRCQMESCHMIADVVLPETAWDGIDVIAPVSGRLVELLVGAGETFARGQSVARIAAKPP